MSRGMKITGFWGTVPQVKPDHENPEISAPGRNDLDWLKSQLGVRGADHPADPENAGGEVRQPSDVVVPHVEPAPSTPEPMAPEPVALEPSTPEAAAPTPESAAAATPAPESAPEPAQKTPTEERSRRVGVLAAAAVAVALTLGVALTAGGSLSLGNRSGLPIPAASGSAADGSSSASVGPRPLLTPVPQIDPFAGGMVGTITPSTKAAPPASGRAPVTKSSAPLGAPTTEPSSGSPAAPDPAPSPAPTNAPPAAPPSTPTPDPTPTVPPVTIPPVLPPVLAPVCDLLSVPIVCPPAP